MLVYIAGPYTKGDVAENVRRAIEAGNCVANLGHTPFIPHLTHFWHMMFPHPWEFWMKQDFQWLGRCQALIRLSGESKGADLECEMAKKCQVEIYYSVEEFIEVYHGKTERM
jgi:hypothetical protein